MATAKHTGSRSEQTPDDIAFVTGIGSRLRELRGDRTLADIAAAVGTLTPSDLSKIETGKRTPTTQVLGRILRALDATLEIR